uniref:Putative hypoxanthine phosphoribosyltransferase (Htp) n=1 Tax=Magnetococcus massalia (strain MO-1) TaxID=451514 RepID=A0A1S7LPG8_MAGMO|nr:Putative hypoxanthine phosphoribosyltransferase (htp) [Candidatus Magnetococcus massalia]
MTQQDDAKALLSHLEPFIEQEQILLRVAELAQQIEAEMEGQDPMILVVLKGGFIFAADLIRAMQHSVPVAFTLARSSHEGPLMMDQGDLEMIKGKDLWIVDGLLDGGESAQHLMEALAPHEPASIGFVILLHKTVDGRQPIPVRCIGFEVPDTRLVGYGLDESQQYRGLKGIYSWWTKGRATNPDEPEALI